MKQTAKIQSLEKIIRPAVDACGVNLWGIEFLPQGKKSLLRVYIDRPAAAPAPGLPDAAPADTDTGPAATEPVTTQAGVSADDCARVSHQVSGVLDVHDPVSGEYTLEVSSPGWDRPFFSFEQMLPYVGQTVHLRLIQPVDNRRKMTGILKSLTPDELVMVVDNRELPVHPDNVDRANLVYQE